MAVNAPKIEQITSNIEYAEDYKKSSPSSNSSVTDDIKNQIIKVFPDNWEIMLEIAKAESTLKVTAYNPEPHKDKNGNIICYGSRGLFQIGCVNYQGNQDDLFDIETNIKLARKVYDNQSYGAWGVCTNGKVKCQSSINTDKTLD